MAVPFPEVQAEKETLLTAPYPGPAWGWGWGRPSYNPSWYLARHQAPSPSHCHFTVCVGTAPWEHGPRIHKVPD